MKLKKVTALLTALTLVFSFATITALAQWVEDTETPPVEVLRGDTPPANGDGHEWRLVDIRVEQGREINGRYEEVEINGRYVDGEELGHHVKGDAIGYYVDGEAIGYYVKGEEINRRLENVECLGYEKIYGQSGFRVLNIEDDSDNSGSYTGTPENGQKFGEQTAKQTELGIVTTAGSNPTITVPLGVTAIVRVQNGNSYTYVEVIGPIEYRTNGNNAWIHDVFENGVDDLERHRGFRQDWVNDGYESIWVQEGFVQIWILEGYEQIWISEGYVQIRVNDGYELIRVNDGFEELVYEIFQRFVWLEDEEVFVEIETGEEYSFEEVIIETLTTVPALTTLPTPVAFAVGDAAREVIETPSVPLAPASEAVVPGAIPPAVVETIEDSALPLDFIRDSGANMMLPILLLSALLIAGIALILLLAFRKKRREHKEEFTIEA